MVCKWFAVWLTVQSWFALAYRKWAETIWFAHRPWYKRVKVDVGISNLFSRWFAQNQPAPPKCRNGLRFSILHRNQPASSSEQMKNWLREGHKDMPWHNIDSAAVSDIQDNSNVNVAPSDTPATEGSDKQFNARNAHG
ncbi:uncharacterized protein FRV6_08697 [Fusarium oxysporum]|uniref:Uncharacterized protein n=1 Tax=Fusarium oxysporum TaxID=5507 RepID=A0A2H3TIK6_FUSOX|nr:uncharacterized protein FRV6_08697 [Fusarium oxysporum]